jgi:hypothetical protein
VEIGATKDIMFVLMHFDICIIFNQGARLILTCFIIYFMGTLLLVALGVDKLGLNIQTKEYVSSTSMQRKWFTICYTTRIMIS